MSIEKRPVVLDPMLVLRVLGLTALALAAVSIGGQILKYAFDHRLPDLARVFDLSLERNIPSFFAVTLMLTASLLLFVVAIFGRDQQRPETSKWLVLAAGFFCMAYDEGFQVHEYLIEPMRAVLGTGTLGAFYYAWVIPGLALVVGLALYFLRFLLRLPPRTRRAFLVAATLYVGGAIGIETIGGGYDERFGNENLTYHLISSLEESLEMAGLIVFIHALLVHLADTVGMVGFGFTPPQRATRRPGPDRVR